MRVLHNIITHPHIVQQQTRRIIGHRRKAIPVLHPPTNQRSVL